MLTSRSPLHGSGSPAVCLVPNMDYWMAHAKVRAQFAPLIVKRVQGSRKEERLSRMK